MIINKHSLGSRNVLHKIWARSVQRFIGYKQTNIQTDKPNLYIDFLTLPLKNLNIFFSPQPMKRVRCKFLLNSLKKQGSPLKKPGRKRSALLVIECRTTWGENVDTVRPNFSTDLTVILRENSLWLGLGFLQISKRSEHYFLSAPQSEVEPRRQAAENFRKKIRFSF